MDRKKMGTLLIALGVMAWPIGYILHLNPVPDILVPHLLFVIPGAYLRGSKILRRLQTKFEKHET